MKDFLSDGGEMGARIRAFDWSATALGRPVDWPPALKISVRLLLSTGHPMFMWWGPELLQFYNDAYRRSIGPERHPSALGQRGRECWDEIWPIIGPQIEHVMAGNGYTWNENQLVPITRFGKRDDVYWTYSYCPIDEPSAPHGVGGVLVVCTETTEQVLAERRLKAAEARWRALFAQTPGFVVVLTGPDHVFEFANPGYLELVGQHDIIGRSLREVLPEIVEQGFVELLDDVYRTGRPHNGYATPLLLSRGPHAAAEQLYLDFVYQPICDASGSITGVFVNGHDVTERVRATEELRDDDRRKNEFLAMLGHELRNPLSAIQNAGELLMRGGDATATGRAIGGLLTRQVNQLSKLVDDLLDVSRIQQGRIELEHEPFDVASAVLLALETVQPHFDAKHHELISVSPGSPLFVVGDRTRIVQAIANILTNAAKYTPPGGTVQARLREHNGMAVVEITDNGVGIGSELLPRVFDLFVQGQRSADRSEGGLGIGLSLVRRLVEMHGGNVSAASAGPGRGSTFTISLPTVPSARPAAAEPRPSPTPPKARRILVVDDNVDAANSLAELLRLTGHDTATAYGALAAIELAPAFDAVLLDIGLPEMDGYEVARRIRGSHAALTLVALTGYGQAADVQRALAAGFDAHLTKPVALETLQRVLTAP
jgi:PAS domain S-box-containing protein